MICVRIASAADGPSIRALLERGGFTQRAAASATDAAHGPAIAAGPPQAALRLVAVDLRSGQLLATARLVATIGLDLPRHAYHVGCAVHASPELRLFRRQRTLFLCNDHTGASELADVAAAGDELPLADRAAALSLVVQSALLWLAQQRQHYAPQLIVALPGIRDAAGQSPFWRGLGQVFSATDPDEALREHGSAWKSHVAALMPRQPVYASFLPASAQEAIAQPHPATQPLRDVLDHEGLRYGHHIDIHDGGPILQALPDDLHSVAASRVWRVALADADVAAGAAKEAVSHAVMALGDPLRAARVTGLARGEQLLISREAAAVLHVGADDRVRAVRLRGEALG